MYQTLETAAETALTQASAEQPQSPQVARTVNTALEFAARWILDINNLEILTHRGYSSALTLFSNPLLFNVA